MLVSNSKAFLLYLDSPVCISSDKQSKPVDCCALILKLLIFVSLYGCIRALTLKLVALETIAVVWRAAGYAILGDD